MRNEIPAARDKEERDERLKAALKANIQKRKVQARARSRNEEDEAREREND